MFRLYSCHGISWLESLTYFNLDWMFIHLGSYSGNISSLQGQPGLSMRISNNFRGSQSSIRSLHRTHRYLLAGGFDEMVHIYNIKQNREEGELNAEQGMVSQIASDGRVLITAGAQGSIKMWKVGKWDLLHQLKEHKGQIESLFVDDSGKVMLSIGKDRKLILWNLLKALRIYDRKLDFEADKVLMTSNKENIILSSAKEIRVMHTDSFTELARLAPEFRIQDMVLFSDQYMVVGNDSGWIHIYPLPKLTHSLKFKAHSDRVKCLGKVQLKEEYWLATASSNGEVKIWDVLNLLVTMDDITQDYTLDNLKPIESFSFGERWISMAVGSLEETAEIHNNQHQVQQQQQEVEEKKPKKIKKIQKLKEKQHVNEPDTKSDKPKYKKKKEHHKNHQKSN